MTGLIVFMFTIIVTLVVIIIVKDDRRIGVHVHDFYEYGDNFTFVNDDRNSCALLFCNCGETREIELGPNGWNSDDYKKEIL